MTINNRKNIRVVMCCLLLTLSLDIVCLIFIRNIPGISTRILYAFFLLIFVLAAWRLLILKVFSMEVSEHIISIKYGHPFSKAFNRPVLEIPLEKVWSHRLEKKCINSFFVIYIRTKRGVKRFYYKLGILSSEQMIRFGKISNFITFVTSYKRNDTGL